MPDTIHHKLLRRLQELDGVIEKASKEKEHIKYVLKRFAPKASDQMELLAHHTPTAKSAVLQLVQTMLKTRAQPMSSGQLYDALQERGVMIKKTSFDGYMSVWCRKPETRIIRKEMGKYALIEEKKAEASSALVA